MCLLIVISAERPAYPDGQGEATDFAKITIFDLNDVSKYRQHQPGLRESG